MDVEGDSYGLFVRYSPAVHLHRLRQTLTNTLCSVRFVIRILSVFQRQQWEQQLMPRMKKSQTMCLLCISEYCSWKYHAKWVIISAMH